MASNIPESPSPGALHPPRSYNKNASPFYPTTVPPNAYYPAYGANNRAQNQFFNGTHFVRIDNLPESVEKPQLMDLINLIIQTNLPGRLAAHRYNLIGFRQNGLSHIEVYNYAFAARLVDLLNGYEWLEKLLEARILDGSETVLEASETADSDTSSSSTLSLPNPLSYYGLYYGPQHAGPQFGYDYYTSTPQGLVSSIPLLPQPPMPLPPPTMNPAYFAPPQYGFQGPRMSLSRRSSSKSVESRKTLRNSSFSRQSYKPVAPFLMNLVGPKSYEDEDEALDLESGLTDFIVVKNEDGQPVKVNPCRLFVGNIPFNSTWTSLKNFLLKRSAEIDPDNPIDLLRVEIPMNNTPSASASPGANFQYLAGFDQKQEKLRSFSGPDEHHHQQRGGSRGFAIVTTRSRASLDRIIEYFDNVEFEGRTLTVRYDKFPEFNNYVLQQLYPNGGSGGSVSGGSMKSTGSSSTNKSSVISNLAFERNSFQQQFYYGKGALSGDSGTLYPQMYYNNMLHYPPQPFPSYYGHMGARPGIYPPSGVPMSSMAETSYPPTFGDGLLYRKESFEGNGYDSEDETAPEATEPEAGTQEPVGGAVQRGVKVENGPLGADLRLFQEKRGPFQEESGPIKTGRASFQEEKVRSTASARQKMPSDARTTNSELSDEQKARDLVNSFTSMGLTGV